VHAFQGRDNELICVSYVLLKWADGNRKQMQLLKIKGMKMDELCFVSHHREGMSVNCNIYVAFFVFSLSKKHLISLHISTHNTIFKHSFQNLVIAKRNCQINEIIYFEKIYH